MPSIALVTGCRTGFGRSIALALARAGHEVYAGLRDPTTGGELMAAAAGLPVTPLALDVTRPDERARALETILARHGRVDLLVNNAGLALDGPLESVAEADLRHLFEVNVFGAWALTSAVLPAMRAQRSGRIVMISSVSGRLAMPLMGAYAASKFALEGLGEAWRHELSPLGIDLTLVEPGPYRTEIFAKPLDPASVPADYAGLARRFLDLRGGVANRAGDPEDVARLVVKIAAMRRPKLRYVLGPTAKLRTTLKRLVPDGLLERLIARVMRPR